jgi:pyruvate/2-oxoglutarate dehydrogenase complex dihydrolipoamide acyltransferase (E2) component
MSVMEVKVPNIDDFKRVEINELLVKSGDRIKVHQSLIAMEFNKVATEISSSYAGVIKERNVKMGDTAAEGSLPLELETDDTKANGPAVVSAPAAPTNVTVATAHQFLHQ